VIVIVNQKNIVSIVIQRRIATEKGTGTGIGTRTSTTQLN